MTAWGDEREAAIVKSRRDYPAPPCPACGGPAEYEYIDVVVYGGNLNVVPGVAHCSARCWETDPDRYLNAIRGNERAT